MSRLGSIGAILGAGVLLTTPAATIAQEAGSVVRGENVRLRAEPAEDPEVVAVLQRGEQIWITGEAVDADGATKPITADTLGFDQETFVPIEVVATGEVGWIREVFVDPRVLEVYEGTGSVAVPAPDAEQPDDADADVVDDAGAQREQRRAERQAQRQAEADAAADEPVDAAEPEPTDTEEPDVVVEGPAAVGGEIFLEGDGDTTTAQLVMPGDRVLFEATHDGDDEFLVTAQFDNGDEEVLFDETGPFEGRTRLRVAGRGDAVLEIQATGPWTVDISAVG